MPQLLNSRKRSLAFFLMMMMACFCPLLYPAGCVCLPVHDVDRVRTSSSATSSSGRQGIMQHSLPSHQHPYPITFASLLALANGRMLVLLPHMDETTCIGPSWGFKYCIDYVTLSYTISANVHDDGRKEGHRLED